MDVKVQERSVCFTVQYASLVALDTAAVSL